MEFMENMEEAEMDYLPITPSPEDFNEDYEEDDEKDEDYEEFDKDKEGYRATDASSEGG